MDVNFSFCEGYDDENIHQACRRGGIGLAVEKRLIQIIPIIYLIRHPYD